MADHDLKYMMSFGEDQFTSNSPILLNPGNLKTEYNIFSR